MRIRIIYLLLFVFYVLNSFVYGQDDYIVNQAKFLQKTNPSFYGMNQLNRVGVLYNSIRVNDNIGMDNKFIFGSVAFQDKNFSLGFDVNSFKLNSIGLTNSFANVTFVYKIQLSNYLFLLPAISGGMLSTRVNTDNLTFGDQLNMATGFTAASSQDPLAEQLGIRNELDIGASFIIKNAFIILILIGYFYFYRTINKTKESFKETKEIIENEQTNSNDKVKSLDEFLEDDELNR